MRYIERRFSLMRWYLMREVVLLSLIMAVFLSATVFTAAQPPTRPSENLAAGKSYQLNPSPNYKHCTDPGDNVQLTDGVYADGHFWTQKETVGWSKANPAVVTIDLGGVVPIRGISFDTAAGIAGVTWPMSILVLVSDDGATYHLAGDASTVESASRTVCIVRHALSQLAHVDRWRPAICRFLCRAARSRAHAVVLFVQRPGQVA